MDGMTGADMSGGGTVGDGASRETPAWWPYAAEFPDWDVFRGADLLCYARRRGAEPPVQVRGEDAVDLRDQVRGVILRAMTS
jgi:hypothetical protein